MHFFIVFALLSTLLHFTLFFCILLLFLCIQKCNRPYAKIINNNKIYLIFLYTFFPLLFYVVGCKWCCCCTHIFIIRKKPLCVYVCLYSHMNIYLHLIFYRYMCNLMQLCTLLLFGIALYAFFYYYTTWGFRAKRSSYSLFVIIIVIIIVSGGFSHSQRV